MIEVPILSKSYIYLLCVFLAEFRLRIFWGWKVKDYPITHNNNFILWNLLWIFKKIAFFKQLFQTTCRSHSDNHATFLLLMVATTVLHDSLLVLQVQFWRVTYSWCSSLIQSPFFTNSTGWSSPENQRSRVTKQKQKLVLVISCVTLLPMTYPMNKELLLKENLQNLV